MSGYGFFNFRAMADLLSRIQSVRVTVAICAAGLILPLAALVPATAGKAGGQARPAYALTTVIGGFPVALNNPDASGTMLLVGSVTTSTGNTHAAVWEATTAGVIVNMIDLGTLPGSVMSAAVDVNDDGMVVGNCGMIGFVEVPGVGMLALPAPAGTVASAHGINNSGAIVGTTRGAGPVFGGVLWHVAADGTITGPVDLGTFLPDDINDSGEIAGQQNDLPAIASFDATGTLQVESLGVLRGSIEGQANAINSIGHAAGCSLDAVPYPHAIEWWPAMESLGTLGGAYSNALDINDSDVVVGYSITATGKTNHAIKFQNGILYDLNGLVLLNGGQVLTSAHAINNHEYIVGELFSKTAGTQGFLLTPK